MDKQQQGFTLIELITVIILLGILSAFAISRFPSSQSYSTHIISNQFIASVRLAQQTALSRSSVDINNITDYTQLIISEISGNWNLAISAGAQNYTAQVERGSEQVRFGTDLVAACSTLTAAPLTLTFDGEGSRVPAQHLRVCIDSTANVEFCVSPSGYVYEGNCIP